MYTIQEVIEFDNHLLQSVSGGSSPFLDGCISAFLAPYMWLPMVLVLLYVLLKNNGFKNFIAIVLLAALMLAASYLLTVFALQPLSEYIRSLYDNDTLNIFDTLNAFRGNECSLLTLTASVTSFALFLMLLVRHLAFNISLALWVIISCFAGVYTAAYYPWDIFAGILLGILCGTVTYYCYASYMKRQKVRRDWVSNRYTKSGYEVSDIYFLLLVMYATFVALPVVGFFILPH